MSHLPNLFTEWFVARGWQVHGHQLAMLQAAQAGKSALLIAPTGGGKTLAGFLPSLVALADGKSEGLHTLYISPLKALAADIERNLMAPITELNLPIRVETRTGDTSASKRQRQMKKPPDILLTTPESLELMLSNVNNLKLLNTLQRVIIDEVHALAPGKRGHLTVLCLTRLKALNPQLTIAGLSATVAEPERLADWLGNAEIIHAPQTAKPDITMLETARIIPWSGYLASYAVPDIYTAIKTAQTCIVFVNTRAQAEWMFQKLWDLNEDNLEIALHHGSLEKDHRQKVEGAMAAGDLRAIVATASLDLGLDWGAVDLVIQVGAPKAISRLLQRIGRSNHQYNVPSRALLVPTNRFETLECIAVMGAIGEGAMDGEPIPPGALDVLAQYMMNCACTGFEADSFYAEIITAQPYRHITREIFNRILEFLVNGGYSLRAYDRFQRVAQQADGIWLASPMAARRHRMNSGTIVEYETLKIGIRRSRSARLQPLGKIEEFFIQALNPGDTFLFAGQLVRYLGIRDNAVEVEKASGERPKIPSFKGGRLPLSLTLANRVLELLEHKKEWVRLPKLTQEWLALQELRSELPKRGSLLIETFPHQKLEYLCAYTFVGRSANQTLGLLLTLAMETSGLMPLGFVASDYALAIWGLKPVQDAAALMHQALTSDNSEAWIESSSMAKRAFRDVAIISGLVERNAPGLKKTGRQVTISTDLIYDVLRKYDPEHILMQATAEEVMTRIANTDRLAEQLAPLPVVQRVLKKLSPLSVPLILEIGIEKIKGGQAEAALLSQHMLEQLREAEAEHLLQTATE